jgi:glucose dehydrogenase
VMDDARGWRVRYRPWRWSAGRAERDSPDQVATARVVVLAANGIETPKLLLLSGLAAADGQVGRNLMDHPVTIAWAQAQQPVYPFRGPPTTSSIESLRDGPFRAFRGAFRTAIRNDGWAMANGAPNGWAPGPPDQASTLLDLVGGRKLFGRGLVSALFERTRRQILIGSAFEMLPDPTNCVSVDRAQLDDLGLPRPRIQFQVRDDPYTRATYEAAIRFHAQIFDAMGATERRLGAVGVPDAGSCHIMGTTMMGRDPGTSVVDSHCRLHGHPSLFVLGSSVFPTGTSANPTATVAALALRAVPTIRAELRGQRVPTS